MSFGGGYNKSQERPAFGVQDQMIANTQQGIPLPYVAGTRKVAPTWVSPVYNLRSVPAGGGGKKGGGGKGKGGGGSQTYNYFGTVAGAVCLGPVTGLCSIIIDGQEAWPGGTAWSNGASIIAGHYYVYDAQTWEALSNHTASYANAPGNATYWQQYVFTPGAGSFDEITVAVQGNASAGNKTKAGEGAPSHYGTLRIYWGKPGQTQDSLLAAAGNNYRDDHPAYQGICYVVLIDWWLGTGTTTAPNLEIVVQRPPKQSLITGSPASLTSDGQANLAAVAAEIFTEQNMLGQDVSILDATSWQNAANLMQANSGIYHGSVLMDTQDTVRSFLDRLRDMTDDFIRWNPATGLIELGVYQHGANPGSYTTLTADLLTDKPVLTNGGWSEVISRAVVSFVDRTLAFQQNTQKADDSRVFSVLGEHRTSNLDRPFMTRASQAIAHATEALKTIGRPVIQVEVTVRREFGRGIRPGDYVLMDIDLEPNVSSLYEFCRVTERTIPEAGGIKLSLVGDNTLSPIQFTNGVPPVIPVTGSIPTIATARVLEAPYALFNESGSLMVLPQRPSGIVTGFHANFDTNTSGTFTLLGGQKGFAGYAVLTSNVASGDTDIYVTVDTTQTDADLFTVSPGALPAANDELLLFLVKKVASGPDAGQVDEDGSGYALVEACSISASTLVSAGHYKLTCLRGRLGTSPLAFVTANVEAWVIYRSNINEFTHAEFATLRANRISGGTPNYGYIRLTPFTFIAELPVASATSIPFHFSPGAISVPTLMLTSPASPLTVSGPTYPYSFTVSGTWMSSNNNLTSWQIFLQKSTDTSARKVAEKIFAPSAAQSFSETAVLEKAGTYTLTLIGYDANGLSSTVVVNIAASGAGAKCAAPVWSSGGRPLAVALQDIGVNIGSPAAPSVPWATGNYEFGVVGPLTLTCSTPGASIFWRPWLCGLGYTSSPVAGGTAGFNQLGQAPYPSGISDGVATDSPFYGVTLYHHDYASQKPYRLPCYSNSGVLPYGGPGTLYPCQVFEAWATAAGMAQSDSVYVVFFDAFW